MFCQCCGIEAPTKKVAFYQNVGALVMRFSKSIEEELCKSCIHQNFWAMTTKTFFLGWWGTISFIITPFLLLNNVIRYLIALPMPAVSEDARVPHLSNQDRERISPHIEELFGALKEEGADFQEVVKRYASRIGLTPGQLMMAIREIIEQTQDQQS